jgi:hypothetical protein
LAQGPEEKYGRLGFVAGLAGRNVAPAAAVSVNVSLLAESARRVGTAWPAAVFREECGDGKAAQRFAADSIKCAVAALHNRLKLLESPLPRHRIHPFTALTGRLIPLSPTDG